jgi:hypothetical protein
MEKIDLNKLTDEELLVERKKLRQSKLFYAIFIGFLIGILIYGFVSWILFSEKKFGFLIPMLIPVFLIYKLVKAQTRTRI